MVTSQFSQNDDIDSFVKVHHLIKENIQTAKLKAQHANMLQYQLPKELKISEVFDLIEKHKDTHRIQDYSLSQTTEKLN